MVKIVITYRTTQAVVHRINNYNLVILRVSSGQMDLFRMKAWFNYSDPTLISKP